MGAVNSADVVRHYPQNPPACTQCPPNGPPNAVSGFIGVPSNETCLAYFGPNGCEPMIPSWTSGGLLFLYSVWLFTLASAVCWACYKQTLKQSRMRSFGLVESSQKRSNSEDPMDEESQSLLQSTDSDFMGDNGPRQVTVEYLRTSKAETIAKVLVIVNGLLLLVYYLILTFDFYLECENIIGSVDNACFFGTFRVFGNYDYNAEVFFLVWLVMVGYCVFLAFFWRDLFDWVSAPATEKDADKVRVWIQDEIQILGSGHLSWAIRLKRWGERRVRKIRVSISRAVWGEAAAFQSTRSGRYSTVPINTTPCGRRYFIFEAVRYAVPGGMRVPLTLENATIGAIRGLHSSNGPESATRRELQDRCGPNAIPLTLPSVGTLLLEEFLTPFYAYQLTIYLIWIWWTYWFVGVWLLLIVFLAGLQSVYLKRKNLRDTYALAAHHDSVRLMKDQREWVFCKDASELVCGDVVKVAIEKDRRDWVVPADLVLTTGSCAVDESGLTGESMPRSKTAISNAQKDANLVVSADDPKFKAHILYAGTRVLEASPDATAVVFAIGTDASRGQLLSHVLFPVKTLFRFDEEFSVAVFLLLIYALVAFGLAIGFQVMNGSESTWPTILAYGVMTVSQIVSPMLKIALVAGRIAATSRLKNRGIACLDPQRIDIAGKVRVFCFDKTGTLTQEGLNFMGFLERKRNGEDTLATLSPQFPSAASPPAKAAATCHSVSFFDGKYLGSAVEVAMFKATGWTLASGDPDETCSPDAQIRLKVKRRLAFDQHRRVMSVVVEELKTNASGPSSSYLYVKGAPESVIPRCISGVPKDILAQADGLAAKGCYVLALAQRALDSETAVNALDAERDELESKLECLGLIIFRNELKSEAAYAIEELKNGHIRCVMITGDNAPCGSFIAKEAGLVHPGRTIILGTLESQGVVDLGVKWKTILGASSERERVWQSTKELIQDLGNPSEDDVYELAVTGEAFDRLRYTGELYDKSVLYRIRVFARMTPTQKVQAVHAFMDGPEGVVCAMCGDGGNDSGALRAAHVGLSMSAAEASVIAPFSSKTGSVFSCVDLITEGRAALATSLASYKYLVIYGLLFSIVKMASFYYAVLMPLLGYVMIDIIAVVPLTFFMTLAKPLKHLGPKRPTSSLLGVQTVSSVTGFLVIAVCSMAVNLAVMANSDGYVQWPAKSANTAAWWFISDNYESTVIWITCFLLFVSSTVIFSFGSGFRDSVYKNWVLVAYVFALYLFSTLILLLPLNQLSVQFHVASEQFNRIGTENPVWQQYQAKGGQPSPGMSFKLRFAVWALSTIAVILTVLWERVMVFGPGGRALKRAYNEKFKISKQNDFAAF